MKVTIIGTGYVGLVTGACLADMGNEVLCLDIDAGKIERLRQGIIPIHEPGLEPVVRRNVEAGRLSFTTDPKQAAEFGLIQMIAVGTPPDEDGSADLRHVLAAARGIGRHMPGYRVIVDKSTVPVGTGDRVEQAVAEELAARGVAHGFSVVSNPEFLKEGAAVDDCMKPDRIVLGVSDPQAEAVMRELYQPFQRNHERTLVMSRRAAELTKYAANAMLATRISFMNDLSRLSEAVGVDIEDVRQGIGSDPRIGWSFLYAGTGYGGSCFPKDVQALIRTAEEQGTPLRLLKAVEAVNEDQKSVLVRKARARFGSLAGRRFALWGLAFKPNTDDMREAPARAVMQALWAEGASVAAYDPIAADECRRLYGERADLVLAASPLEAVRGADALVIVTEWKEFRSPSFDEIRARLNQPVIFDGRNLYDPATVARHGLEYHSIGRPVAGG
ncbi:MAG: UDP-glucose/GDP-mannose dehydrogenase family protein [Betaproteobacteria bacterium]|nr:UDP-glucose/GDP-mannose dehydrogenase family protein [Betaproteobacteria bacterium]